MRFFATVSLLVTVTLMAATGIGRADLSEQAAWLLENAIEFETAEAGHGFDDLEPLREVIGEARIVALGETTHGTREHFQMKHRLMEYLASEMGFTIFSIEASTPEAYRVNEHVLEGKGDPKSLIGGMYFWTWNTLEVLAMVEWMREFNEAGRGPIHFTGFDMQTPDVAMQIVKDFIAQIDPKKAQEVKQRYDEIKDVRFGSPFGVATMTFPVEEARGKHLRYSGYIKTEDVTDGYAGLWWRADTGNRKVGAFDNMQDRGPKGTTEWTQYVIELDVPEETTNINFGVLMPAKGTAWFDALKVELDGIEFTDTEAFDLDFGFEKPRISGYYASNDAAYRSTLDAAEAFSGEQSLRIAFGSSGTSSPERINKAVGVAREILMYLEEGREDCLERFPAEEVDWAIHNAEIVHQCLRSRAPAEHYARDKAMAENVTWILEQNPDAKIVLWAHNAHISRKHGAMGFHLDREFGDSYLPVGFAAARGQYTAVADTGLGTNQLSEPPEGSIESYFAETGKQRLILDLRRAAPESDASKWLTESREFRSIGAKAMEQQFHHATVTDDFDVLVYFEDTTPAVQLDTKPKGK
jgi:erythromycin esterase-like protein